MIMNNTEHGSQPIKTAKQIFKEAYEAKTGEVCDDTILEHMAYAIEAMEVYIQPILTAAKVSTVDEVVQMLERKDLEGIAVEHHIGGDADTFVKDHRGNLQGKERFELLSMLKDFAITSCIKYHQHFAKQPIANTKTLTDDEIEDVIERFKDDTSSSVFATHTFTNWLKSHYSLTPLPHPPKK